MSIRESFDVDQLHMVVHHSLHGHPSAFIWTSIRTSMEVHQLSYGRPSVLKLTSVALYIDAHFYLSGRPTDFIWTSISTNFDFCFHWKSNSTSEDINQFSSRHPSYLRTSTSYQTDVHKNSHGRPSAFILTSIKTFIDIS